MDQSESEKKQREAFLRAVASKSPSLEKLSTQETQDPERESTLCNESRSETAPRPDGNREEQTTSETGEDEKDQEGDYPSGWRLTLITIGLCLCVFCTALVC